MLTNSLRRALTGLAVSACLLTATHAGTVYWNGANAGTMSTASNWTPSTDLVVNPSQNVIFNNASATVTTVLAGNNLTVRSISVDDTSGLLHNATTGLRIASTSSGTSNAIRTLTFDTAGVDVISLSNGANLTFRNSTVTPTAGYTPSMTLNLNFTGTGVVRVDATSKLTVTNASISGTGGIVKEGAGTLFLLSGNTFSGGLTVNAGAVSVDAAGNLGSATSANTDAVVLNGGTLQFTGGTTASSGNRGFRVGTSGGTIDVADGVTTTLLGAIRDVAGQHGMLTKTGSGTLTLTGANSYSGSTTVQGGALVGDANGLQGAIVLNNASSITFNQTSDGTYAGSLSGNGSFNKLGAGSLLLTNQSSHTGLNTVAEGSLLLQDAVVGGLASAGFVLQSGASLGGSGIIRGNASLADGSRLSMDTYLDGVVANPIGKISFNNNLDLSGLAAFTPSQYTIIAINGAPISFDLGADNFSDQITVYGTLNIGTGLLGFEDFNFTTADTLHAATYTLFTAPNYAIVGSLGDFTTMYFGDGFTGTLALASNAITLTLVGAPIPEPATYAALLGGLAALAAIYRRRRAR